LPAKAQNERVTSRGDQSTIVTQAYQSRGEEIDARKKRYVYAMSGRVVLIAVSVLLLRTHLWALLPAMLFSAVLPWFAVVLSNGGRKTPEMADRYDHQPEPMTPIAAGRTIDGD
jgi:hypothetical protein